MSAPTGSVLVYVLDAVGDKFCYSVNDAEYRASAVRHARWWMRQRKHVDFSGKPLPICRPLRLIVEELAE